MAAKQPKTPISNRGFNAQFLSIAPLQNPLVLDRVVASIDSIRVKYTYPKNLCHPVTFERTDTLQFLFDELTSISRWLGNTHEPMGGRYDTRTSRSSFRIANYACTISYTLPNGNGFAVLIGRYHADEDGRHTLPEIVLDFNPNKIPVEIWGEIASILAPLSISTTIQRFDLALDFNIPRQDLSLIQRPGSEYNQYRSADGTALTEYTGQRSQHGNVKLYDKGAELGQPDLDVSRCEITIDPKRLESSDPRLPKSIKGLFPTITTYSPMQTNLDFDALPFPVKAVILHPDLYDLMKQTYTGNTWRKYKAMIQAYGKTELTLTPDEFKQIDRYVWDRLRNFTNAGTELPFTA